MQAATAEGNKGSQQHVFVLPESPSSKFHTHHLQEIKQPYSTTAQRPLKLQMKSIQCSGHTARCILRTWGELCS